MAQDPISLASSIIAFVDAATRFKSTFAKANSNSERLHHIDGDIRHGLGDIDRFCRARYARLDDSEAVDIKNALSDLRCDLLDVQSRIEILLLKESTGIISTATSSLKAWFRRDSVEDEALRLEKHIRACYVRFAAMTAIRTEYSVLFHHQEHLARLEHLEDLVSYMLAQNGTGKNLALTQIPGPDEIDYRFAHRQVRKIAIALDKCNGSWVAAINNSEISPTLDFEDLYYVQDDHILGVHFRQGLRRCLCALQNLNGNPNIIGIKNCASNLFLAGSNFLGMAWFREVGIISKSAIRVLELFKKDNRSQQFNRMLALSTLWSAEAASKLGDAQSFALAKIATKSCHDVYDRNPDARNLFYLVQALNLYDIALFRRGDLEKSFDCSVQSLILMRTAGVFDSGGGPVITWSASGEADVVYSSRREFCQPHYLCWHTSTCIWSVAKSLAFAGRYAEGRIAANDAISCLEGILSVLPQRAETSVALEYIRTEISSWVSSVRGPSLHEQPQASIEELTEEFDP